MTRITFQGEWTPQNICLTSSLSHIFQSDDLSIVKKIDLIFWRSLESVMQCICPARLHNFAQTLMVPSSVNPEEAQAARTQWTQNWNSAHVGYGYLRSIYDPLTLHVNAPDGTGVEGVFYRHRDNEDQDIPTILCFNGNGSYPYTDYWNYLLTECSMTDSPFNVIVCNYAPPKIKSIRDVVLYGDLFFQAALDQGISEENIHFAGMSLGGAIAALVAALHPEAGRMVNINSFDSMHHFILDQQMVFGNAQFIKWIASKILSAIGWALEPGRALNALRQKTLFLYTRADEVISPRITAVQAVGGPKFRGNHAIEMQIRQGAEDSHNTLLSNYHDREGIPVLKRIVDFFNEGE
jgi:pimeloyl-ACP methyl ester carboxylesterase